MLWSVTYFMLTQICSTQLVISEQLYYSSGNVMKHGFSGGYNAKKPRDVLCTKTCNSFYSYEWLTMYTVAFPSDCISHHIPTYLVYCVPDFQWHSLRRPSCQHSFSAYSMISKICIRSLETRKIPEIWKCANIVPIYKKGKKDEVNDYRPVSLTRIICKILQSIIRDHIMENFTVNKLFTNK